MAEKLQIPTKVIDSDWKDDIDYESYADEAEYISPEQVEHATAERAKSRNVKIGRIALFSKNAKLTA